MTGAANKTKTKPPTVGALGKVTILKAEFGAGTKRTDVTETLQKHIDLDPFDSGADTETLDGFVDESRGICTLDLKIEATGFELPEIDFHIHRLFHADSDSHAPAFRHHQR